MRAVAVVASAVASVVAVVAGGCATVDEAPVVVGGADPDAVVEDGMEETARLLWERAPTASRLRWQRRDDDAAVVEFMLSPPVDERSSGRAFFRRDGDRWSLLDVERDVAGVTLPDDVDGGTARLLVTWPAKNVVGELFRVERHVSSNGTQFTLHYGGDVCGTDVVVSVEEGVVVELSRSDWVS